MNAFTRLHPVRLAGLCLLLAGLAPAFCHALPSERYTPARLAGEAPQVRGEFRLDGLLRPGGGETWLTLSPQPIFTEDAVLVLVGEDGEQTGPAPALRHFHGHERDDAAALAFVSVHPDGRIHGWLRRGGRIEGFGREPGEGAASMALVQVDMAEAAREGRRSSCGNEMLPAAEPAAGPLAAVHGHAEATPAWRPSLAPAAERVARTSHWVNVAIDSDYEYYARFNNVDVAAWYAADLIGFSSLLYRNEVDTGLVIPYLRLFTTPADPWQQASATTCMMFELGQHWHQHNSHVQRTITHLLSGKDLQGGIAWIGVLCQANQQLNIGNECPGLPAVGPYFGGYGVSTSLLGNFNPGNPQMMWDINVVAHEIGHNFSSPHTHCYGGIGGHPSPVDQCYVEQAQGFQCHAGATSLPGPAGQGAATVMSYCHLLPGGFSNVAFSFGTNHSYGVLPARVPSRMHAHVLDRFAANPACFAAPAVIYQNGFECAAGLPGCGAGGNACLSSAGATANGPWFSGDPANTVRSLNIGAGNQLTGIAVDVRVEARAPSWLSEARLVFSSSNPGQHAISYTPGLNQETPGTINHSSNGVLDFAGAGLQNVVAGADGILRVEWNETFDDPSVTPDSLWSNHPAPTVCPGIRLICSNQAACDAAMQAAP